MKNKRAPIHRILSVFLLWVFTIALTPWSALHHHETQEVSCTDNGKLCRHNFHLSTEKHNCLVCSAHFVKDFYLQPAAFRAEINSRAVPRHFPLFSTAYTALISLALRGPPAA